MKLASIRLIALLVVGLAALGAGVWVFAGTTGIVSGVVKSDDGKLLSGANVIIVGAKLTTVTDANGYYVITNVPPGDYEVRAEMVGYAAASDRVSVSMDATAETSFGMTQEAIKETTAVVTRARPMIAADQVNTLNLMSASQYDLTRTDPTAVNTVPGALGTVPGVYVEPNQTGLMHLRGGRSDQIGYYIEGIPVTDPNLGTFTDNMFSTGVNRFQAYTGGFGAEYGNALAGVLNEVKKTGDTSSGLRLMTYGGSDAYRSATAEVGGSTPRGLSYYVSGINQHNDISGSRVIQEQNYTDNVAKVVFPWKNDSLTIIGMQGILQGELGGDVLPAAGDFMRQRYALAGAVWSHTFDARSFLTVRPYYIYCDALQSLVNNYGGYSQDANSKQTGLTVGYTNQMNERQLLKLGGSVLSSDNNNFVSVGIPWSTADVNTFQTSLYAEQQIKVLSNWTLSAGARLDSITYDRTGRAYIGNSTYDGDPVPDATESTLTPRLGVSYSVDDRTAWKASWGRYTKFVPANSVQTTYAVPPNTPGAEDTTAGLGATSPQFSTAGEISFEKQVSDSVAVRVTPYYADYRNLGDYVTVGPLTTYTSLGKGRSRGVEFYARKRMSDNWQSWLSYTVQTVEANQNGAGPLSYTSWDQRHTLALVTDYKTGAWSHTLRADFGSGRADSSPTPGANQRSDPYAIFTYGLTMDLPKGSRVADSVSLGVFNVFNNRQVAQYTGAYGPRSADSWVGDRSVSLGLNKAF